jgi:hypothetical protein
MRQLLETAFSSELDSKQSALSSAGINVSSCDVTSCCKRTMTSLACKDDVVQLTKAAKKIGEKVSNTFDGIGIILGEK